MTVTVFTAALGTTDTVRAPLEVDPAVRYLCFSDRPVVQPYEWIQTEPTDDPRSASRKLKILADHDELQADLTLWHDASYQLHRALSWVRDGLKNADMVALRHPRRNRIEDEAPIVAKYGYLTIDLALAHVARYRDEGFTENVLTSGGLLARRVSAKMQRFNTVWWGEVQQWGGRDQASLDYSAWREHVRILHLHGTVRLNAYAGWRPLLPVVPA